MTLSIELTPDQEARLVTAAQRQGTDPQRLAHQFVIEHLPAAEESANAAPQAITAENDATIALLQSWMQEDATEDPEELRAAEEELREFKRNMNKPRKETGARLHYPEVE